MKNMNYSVAAALTSVLFWSTNALAAKYGLAALNVSELLTIQFSAAAITFLFLYILRHRDLRIFSGLPPLKQILIGLVGLVGTIILQYIAFGIGNILEANVIAYSWPLIVAVWAAVVLRNRIGLAGIGLALIGFYGVVMIMAAKGTLNFLEQGINPGGAVAFASALCMAFYTVASSNIRMTEKLLIPVTLIGAGSCFIFACFQNGGWPEINDWGIAAYIGVGPMAIGYFLWSYAMSGDGAKIIAPIGYATPLLSTVLLLVSGEDYTQRTMYGILLILSCSLGVLFLQHIHSKS
ncbi:DMT family transporter [Desulfospira joergensenii]|uniref:DMT family transporter n=1 Tax=Desulfospira joergensenii TaxID=53329 RepID=UPI0013769159|nr:DMT family transporter [Desulfospira joergensenii]